jgi:hypothetical protein
MAGDPTNTPKTTNKEEVAQGKTFQIDHVHV